MINIVFNNNASVGRFGTDTLMASSAALASGAAADDSYAAIDSQLSTLGSARDALATSIKNALDQVAFHDVTPAVVVRRA